ncbi:MAG: DUF4865 family protein [Pseudomonadota bacterium]
MFIKQYRHRLPADYDMSIIRSRVAKGGPVFDDRPHLAFKAFSVEDAGQMGATNNAYSSLYLWFEIEAVADFLWYKGFQNVFDTFGRPTVETWLAIDAARGQSDQATMLYREDADMPPDQSLADLRTSETERNRQTAARPGTVASVVGIELATWRIARFTLSETVAQDHTGQKVYQVAYLAKPGLDKLST